jgi:hypothetical protein
VTDPVRLRYAALLRWMVLLALLAAVAVGLVDAVMQINDDWRLERHGQGITVTVEEVDGFRLVSFPRNGIVHEE